jgi:microcystin degradation protein MlrC
MASGTKLSHATFAPKVLVGGMFLESHSFAPLPTTAHEFLITRGATLIETARASESILAGGIRALEARGANIVPIVCAVAPPGGLAEHAVYVGLRDELVAAAIEHRPDAIFLQLHGAMGTTELEDSEGELVSRLREAVGPNVPIAAGLDMHACVTRAMLQATPIWVACKENPHIDYSLAGARAAEILLQTLAATIRPVSYAIWLPLLLRGKLGTKAGPLAELHALRRSWEQQPEIEDISIYNTYAFLDAREAGQCVTVTANDLSPQASATAESLAREIWDRREEFGVDRPSVEEVFGTLKAGEGPLIVGDHGDRVLGGSPGDGTFLLRYILSERPDLRVLLPLTDPVAVERAIDIGVGGTFEMALGGRITRDEAPVSGRWQVKHLGEGSFIQQGPFMANEPAEMGRTAVLASGNLTLIVTTRPGFSQDPAFFLSNGEDPARHDVVVCKSGFHFEPAFASYGRCVALETPGLTNYVPGRFKFVRRPSYWPEDPAVVPDFRVHSFALRE